jgi:hypothetical protein
VAAQRTYFSGGPAHLPSMNAFATRRSTETQISGAITLGWRIAVLYSLRAGELPSSPPDNMLPMRRSLPAAERLALELRAAAGDADRLGIGLADAELAELLDLAVRSPESDDAEAEFHDRIRTWHIHLQTMLWADHEATGKAYELGSFLSDTSNRVVRGLRGLDDPRGHVTRELRAVFERERVERIKRLLDDLEAKIDPAAVRIVKEHLDAWHAAVGDRTPRATTRAGLEPLDSQVVIWFQLVTGDKEPEAFIGHDDRTQVRGTMIARMASSYRRSWPGIVALAAIVAAAVLLVPWDELDKGETTRLVALLSPVAGALGLRITSIGLTVRKSLDARAELLWNTALVEVISAKTLRVDEVLKPALARRRHIMLSVPRPRSHDDGTVRRMRAAPRLRV